MAKIFIFDHSNTEFYVTEFASTSVGPEGRVVGPYVRNTYLLHIIINGTCHFSEFEANAGEAFLISRNKLHSFTVEEGYLHYWFSFSGNKAEDLLRFFGISTDMHVKFHVENFDYVKGLLQSTFIKYVKDPIADEKIAKSTLLSVIPFLSCDNSHSVNVSDIDIIARYICNNYQEKISMQILADAIHITQKHLCKKFKKRFGMSPQEYLINTRMKAAKELLAETNLKIKEISISVGYSSQLNFSNIFKKKIGQSPQMYRIHSKNLSSPNQ